MVDERDNYWERRVEKMLEYEHDVGVLTKKQVNTLLEKLLELRAMSPEMDAWIDSFSIGATSSKDRIIDILLAWSDVEQFHGEHKHFEAPIEEFRAFVETCAKQHKKQEYSPKEQLYLNCARAVDALSVTDVAKGLVALDELEETLASQFDKLSVEEQATYQVLLLDMQRTDATDREKLLLVLARLGPQIVHTNIAALDDAIAAFQHKFFPTEQETIFKKDVKIFDEIAEALDRWDQNEPERDVAFDLLKDIKQRVIEYIQYLKQKGYDQEPWSYDVGYFERFVADVDRGDLQQILIEVNFDLPATLRRQLHRQEAKEGHALAKHVVFHVNDRIRALQCSLENFHTFMVSPSSQVFKQIHEQKPEQRQADKLDKAIEARVAMLSDDEVKDACTMFKNLQAQAELLRDRTQHVTSSMFSSELNEEAKSVHDNMNRLLRIIKHNEPDVGRDEMPELRHKVGTMLLHLERAHTLSWLKQDKTLDALGARFKRVDMLLSPFVAAVNAFRWCFNLEPIQPALSVDSFKTDLLKLKNDVGEGFEGEEEKKGPRTS